MSVLRGRCSNGTNRQQLKNLGELKSCGEKAFLVFLQNQNRTVAILSEHTAKCLCKCVTSAAPYSFCKGSVGSLGLGLGLALDKYSKNSFSANCCTQLGKTAPSAGESCCH